jgi:cyanophycin synthetase
LLDGELLDTVTNLPPRVVGNGHSTVEELVAAENERRLAARGDAGLELLELDLDMALALRAAGHTLATVPAAGEVVPIKSVSNDLRLEDAATYRGAVHPDVVEQARRAASIVGLRLAGVDIMAPSVDRPLAETGGVVLEVNGAPGFHRHYHVADRDGATPVADRLVEHLLGGDRHERPDGDQLPGGR